MPIYRFPPPPPPLPGYLAAIARATSLGVLTESDRAALLDAGVVALVDARVENAERIRSLLAARAQAGAAREVGG